MMFSSTHCNRIGGAKSALTLLCVFVFGLSFTLPAVAQSTEARQLVSSSEENLDALIVKFPALKDVADVISADCGKKLPEQAKVDGFCRCGSAVTFGVWRAGGDGGKMLQKLAAYASNPTPAGASDFVNYQGPELYKPVCELALGISHG